MDFTFRKIYSLQIRRSIFKRVTILAFLISLLFPFLSSAQFNHPELNWRVIETPHFLVHYHQEEENFARDVARIAEEVYIPLSQDIGYHPLKKIPIVIENYNDTTGGYTSTLTGKIVIQAQSDTAQTSGNLSWPREVIAHELTHALSFAAIGESIFPLRRMIASLVLPMWFIEGLAEYEGEQWTSLKKMWVSDEAYHKRIMSEGDLGAFYFFNGWGRTSGYYQSDSFVRYIFETYGRDKIHLIFDNLRAQPLFQLMGVMSLGGGEGAFYPAPRFLNFDKALKKAVGKNSITLYREWRNWILKKYKDKGEGDEHLLALEKRLTSKGRRNQHPRFSPSGKRVAFVSNRGYDFALFDLYLMDIATKKVKRVEEGVNPSFSFSPDGKRIAYSKVQFYPPKRAFLSDIWILNVEDGQRKRITYGQRASEPCFSPDGERLVFVRRQGGNSNLWLVNLKTHKLCPLTRDRDGLAQNFSPDFSPNGKRIVFVSFCQGKRDIYLLRLKDKTIVRLTKDRADDRCPVFSPSGNKIYFISDRKDGVFNLYSINLNGKDLKRYTDVRGGVFEPSLSKDGKKIVVSGYKDGKFSLFLFSCSKLKGEKVKTSSNKVKLIAKYHQKEAKFKDYPYRARIKIQYLLPWFSLSEEGSYFSLEGYASDVLEKHQFYLSTSLSENLQYDFFYINRSFLPTFWIDAYHIKGYGEFKGKIYPIDKEEKSLGLLYYINEKIGTGISFSSQNLSTSLFSLSGKLCPFNGKVNSLRAEIGYSNQIPVASPEFNRWGKTLYLYGEWSNPKWGSDLEYNAYEMDFRDYWKLSDKRHLALRVLSERVENKQPSRKILFSLGGMETLPGYPKDYLLGENLFLSSLEYRSTWLKRIGGSSYLYLDRLGVALFYNVGTAWGKEERLNWQNLLRSCGAEFRLRMIPFGKYSSVLRLGIAWPLDYNEKRGSFFLTVGGIF